MQQLTDNPPKADDPIYEQWETDDSKLFTQFMNSMEPSVEDMVQKMDSMKEFGRSKRLLMMESAICLLFMTRLSTSTKRIKGTRHITITYKPLRS